MIFSGGGRHLSGVIRLFETFGLLVAGTVLFWACGNSGTDSSPEGTAGSSAQGGGAGAPPSTGGSAGAQAGGGGAGVGGSGAGSVGSGGSGGSTAGTSDGSVGAAGTAGTTGTGGTVGTGGTGGSGGTGVTCGPSPAAASQLLGFAAHDGATTGGGNASPETVSSAGDLEDAVSGSSPKVVRFSGTLSVGSLEVGSNTTLEGANASATINGGISLDDVENVILRNLRVNGANSDVDGDAIGIRDSARIWIDHLEIYDAEDGLLDITSGSDRITVSWTKFRYSGPGEHHFAVLIGSSDSDSGNYRITFHHNWWGPFSDERMPRVRFGDVHVFNNYYGTGTDAVLGNDHCIRAGYQSNVLVQSNYFDRVNTPHEVAEDQNTGVMSAPKCPNDTSAGGPPGCNVEYLSLNTDSSPSERGTAFNPPYEYQSAMEPADCVKANVMAGAGPR